MFIACIVGYIWLYFSLITDKTENKSSSVCILKHTTNIPCPSCGSTRSVIALAKGNFGDALLINPLGYIIAIIMLIAPFWILFDMVTQRKTLYKFYLKLETYLKAPRYAIPLIGLVIINWIWNVTKEL